MKKIGFLILSLVFLTSSYSQITTKGHTNENKFKQMYDLLATPNEQHNASGAPGKGYTQQKVDYKIDITLDDEKQKIIKGFSYGMVAFSFFYLIKAIIRFFISKNSTLRLTLLSTLEMRSLDFQMGFSFLVALLKTYKLPCFKK